METIVEKIGEGHLTYLVAGALIVFCLHLILKMINMGITVIKNLRESDVKKMEKHSHLLEENTRAIHKLTTQLSGLNQRIADTDMNANKLEASHGRLVATVREGFGSDKFFDIQKKIKDDQFK